MDNHKKSQCKSNPREKSSFLSSLFFLFMIPIFYKSIKYGFKEDDLFEALKEDNCGDLGEKLEETWTLRNKRNKKWSLHLALWNLFGFIFMITGILTFMKELASLLFIPYLIRKLVAFFSATPEEISNKEAYFYAGGLVATIILERLIAHPVMFWNQHLATKIRISCSSLIYRKLLRFSKSSSSTITLGHVVNLITNNLSRLDYGFNLVHYIWISPIQAVLAIAVLYFSVGSASFFGVGFLFILFPLQLMVARKTAQLRLKTATKTDGRVRLMNEIITGIQVIKMYTWEISFAKLIQQSRKKEMKIIRNQKLLAAVTSFEKYATKVAMFITLICLYLMGEEISAEIVFSVAAIYDVLNRAVSTQFEVSVRSIAEMHVSFNRVNAFLNKDENSHCAETKLPQIPINSNGKHTENVSFPQITLQNVSVKWDDGHLDFALENISLKIETPELFAIVGAVGSGKTTLLNVILRELPILKGTLRSTGSISYSSQEPWIFPGTLRQNILFGAEYNQKRYRKVCKACGLDIDFQQFVYGDRTEVGEKGNVLSGGQKARVNLARCVYRNADIYLLDDPLSAVDTKVAQKLFNDCIRGLLQDKICILITHQLQFLKGVDNILILKEGKNVGLGSYNELQSNGLDFKEFLGDVKEEEYEENTRCYVRELSVSSQISDVEIINEDKQKDHRPTIEKEKLVTGVVKSSVYKQYFQAGGSNFVLLLLVLSIVLFEVASRGCSYFLSYWVNTEDKILDWDIKNQTEIRNTLVYEYSGVITATVILAIFHHIFFVIILIRASINLHNHIFQQLLKAKMLFFNNNPAGRILNRFSKDLGTIDEQLPTVLFKLCTLTMSLLGIIVLTSTINLLLLPPAIGLLLLFYGMRIVYIKTSRCVKRIEGITRSPILNHFTTTFDGLSSIRAYSAETMLIQEFNSFQNMHTSAYMLFLSATRAFGFWLDLICGIFIGVVIVALVILNKDMPGGDFGLIITQYMGLMGTIQFAMRQWSELENHMTSVERILEYTELDNEPQRIYKESLPEGWPNRGELEFQKLSLQYLEDEPILRELTFQGNPAEKIGIVGRTGAGKSSIITALFQLYETEGSILIDNVDITKLPLHILRSKISIVPQEPILFTGTMRKNLDPFDEYGDDILWHALEQVELKDLISDMPQGLNTHISEGGANYSVGQRQLVCLARAIIRRNKLLVLDEATANVDPHTDELIQKTIRFNFAQCTVLTIAHRLHTIMDCDKVLVIDFGKIIEFDEPRKLLENSEGVFRSMVESTGTATSKHLFEIAGNI